MKRALIIGGSLGGLFAANLLHARRLGRPGIRAGGGRTCGPGRRHRHPRRTVRGAGGDRHRGSPTSASKCRGASRWHATAPCWASSRMPQILTAWGRVYSLLRAALPAHCYHNGKQLVSVQQDDASVRAVFADGERAERRAAGRGRRHPLDRAPAAAPEVEAAIRGLRGVARPGGREPVELTPPMTRCSTTSLFCLPPREQMLGYPVAGAGNAMAAGRRRYNFVWYRPADEARSAPTCYRRQRASVRRRHPAAADPRRRSSPTCARAAEQSAGTAVRRSGAQDCAAILPADLSTWNRRSWCSAGSSCWAMPPSSRGRTAAWA